MIFNPVINYVNPKLIQIAITETEIAQKKLDLIEMDPDEPRKNGMYEGDGTHMKNMEGTEFWTKVFTRDLE